MPGSKRRSLKDTIQIRSIKTLLTIFCIEGLFCVIWIVLIPSSGSGAVFGFSLQRLLLIAVPLIPSMLSSILLISMQKKPDFLKKFFTKENILRIVKVLFPISVLLSIGGWSSLFFYHLLNTGLNPYINQRMLPLTAWITLTTLTIIVCVPRIFGKENISYTICYG